MKAWVVRSAHIGITAPNSRRWPGFGGIANGRFSEIAVVDQRLGPVAERVGLCPASLNGLKNMN